MKKITIILTALVFVSLLFTSCQKAKEPEGKKETQVQQAQKEEVKQPAEMKPTETKPEVQPQPAAPTAKEEKPQAMEPGPLTEAEQKFVEKMDFGPLTTPNAFETIDEAKKYLKILLKGNHRNVRFFTRFLDKERSQDEYGIAIRSALSVLNPTKKKNFKLFIRVLEEKRDYPKGLSEAIRALRGSGDKRVIELDKELLNHPAAGVRLEAAGALLIEGYGDVALPVLDELTEKEGYSSALYLLFAGPGKIIDEHGYKIVEKALNNPKAEVKITAVKLLLESKKITNEKAEEITLGILDKFKDYTLKNYGLTHDPSAIHKIIPLQNSSEINIDRATQDRNSDSRACEYTMSFLGRLKSKKAIPPLRYIEKNNTEWWYNCWDNNARDALHTIEGE